MISGIAATVKSLGIEQILLAISCTYFDIEIEGAPLTVLFHHNNKLLLY